MDSDSFSQMEYQSEVYHPSKSLRQTEHLLQTESEIELTTTERGGKCLVESNFTYAVHRVRVKGDVVHWQCVHRGNCNARIHTMDLKVVRRINEHSPEQNNFIFVSNNVKAKIKEKASDTWEELTISLLRHLDK